MNILDVYWQILHKECKGCILQIEEIVGNSVGGNIRTAFSEDAKSKLEYLVNRLDEEKLERWYPSRVRWKNLFESTVYIAKNQAVGVLKDSIRFSALNQLSLLAGEILSPAAEEFIEKPGHPYRDHVSHVSLVFLMGLKLLDTDDQTGLNVLNNIIEATKNSETWKLIINICEDDLLENDEEVKKIILIAWIIAALCHDMAYTEEIQTWLEKDTCIDSFFKCSASKLTYRFNIIRRRIYKAIDNLSPDDTTKMGLRDILLGHHRVDENRNYFDHGQLSSIMLLSYYTANHQLEQLKHLLHNENNLGLPALLLACFAMYDHDKFGTKSDERLPNVSFGDRAEKYWRRNPLGVALATTDLLAEGLRLSWKVLHEAPLLNNAYTRTMVLNSFIGISDMFLQYDHSSQTFIVGYQCLPFQPTGGGQKYKYSGKPYNHFQAVYEENEGPPLNWQDRRLAWINGEIDRIPVKEQRLNSLWGYMTNHSSYMFLEANSGPPSP